MDLQDHANVGSTISLWGAVESLVPCFGQLEPYRRKKDSVSQAVFFFLPVLKIISNPKLQGNTLIYLSLVIEVRASAA